MLLKGVKYLDLQCTHNYTLQVLKQEGLQSLETFEDAKGWTESVNRRQTDITSEKLLTNTTQKTKD